MAWDRIPSEVFDLILQGVDLETIKNVRLVNKVTAQRCLSPRFLSFASHIQTDLTEQSLWKLMARASHPVFSRVVRQLNMVAVCYDHRGKNVLFELDYTTRSDWNPLLAWGRPTTKETPRARYDLEWLQQQLAIREKVSDQFIMHVISSALDSFTDLQQISLQAQVWTSASERWSPYAVFAPVMVPWATHVCYLTLAAVAMSKSSVPEIDIYGKYEKDSNPTDKLRRPSWIRCGVSITELGHYFAKINDSGEVRLPFESMKLYLSTGTQTQPESEIEWLQIGYSSLLSGFSSSVWEEKNPNGNDQSGVMRLLKATPDLRDLTIDLDHESLAIGNRVRRIFTSMADQTYLHQLRKCELISLPVTSAALLKFLEAHRGLEYLTLQDLSIPFDDNFDPVFHFIGAEVLELKTCTMSDLYRGDTRVNLDREAFAHAYCPHRPYLPIEFASGVPAPPDIYLIFVPQAIVKAWEENNQK